MKRGHRKKRQRRQVFWRPSHGEGAVSDLALKAKNRGTHQTIDPFAGAGGLAVTNTNPKARTREHENVVKIKFELYFQGRESWTAVGLLSAFLIGLIIAISVMI